MTINFMSARITRAYSRQHMFEGLKKICQAYPKYQVSLSLSCVNLPRLCALGRGHVFVAEPLTELQL